MQISDSQREFLNGVHFAVVATIAPDGLPHQTVMWYLLDGDELLLNTPHDSLKHRHLKRDSRISVCVEQTYRYVTITGTVRIDEDPTVARADYQRLGERYRGTINFTPPAKESGGGQVPELLSRQRVTLRVNIERIHSSGLP